ncbi:MAG: hypothetical protein LBI27_07575 [Clostridiales bacterium]|jgi:hypothetical protein|nr:hypothetical protein [Clostridiales bacterium]
MWWQILLIVAIVVLILGIALYFLNSWAGKKQAQQNEMVAQHKQTVSLYVIDKKKDKLSNANIPKAMVDQVPRYGRLMKMPLVKVKMGPQIITMVCEEETFKALPVKKTVTVDIAGAYIVGMKGMKTKLELQQQRKSRRKGRNETVEAPMKWHEKLLAKIKR